MTLVLRFRLDYNAPCSDRLSKLMLLVGLMEVCYRWDCEPQRYGIDLDIINYTSAMILTNKARTLHHFDLSLSVANTIATAVVVSCKLDNCHFLIYNITLDKVHKGSTRTQLYGRCNNPVSWLIPQRPSGFIQPLTILILKIHLTLIILLFWRTI